MTGIGASSNAQHPSSVEAQNTCDFTCVSLSLDLDLKVGVRATYMKLLIHADGKQWEGPSDQ